MHIECRACRLLFLQHCIRQIRRVYARDDQTPYKVWLREVNCNGVNLPTKWGWEAVSLAEEILEDAISRPQEIAELSTAPDSVFTLISATAAYLVIIKLSTFQSQGVPLAGPSDAFLDRTVDLLKRAACGSDHVPARCAHLISALVRSYQTQIRHPPQQPHTARRDHDPTQKMLPRVSDQRPQPQPSLSLHYNSDPDHQYEHLGSMVHNGHRQQTQGLDPQLPGDGLGVGMEMNEVMNSDLMLDSDFWASFMSNLTANGEGLVGFG